MALRDQEVAEYLGYHNSQGVESFAVGILIMQSSTGGDVRRVYCDGR